MIIPVIYEESYEKIEARLSQVEGVARKVQIDISDGVLYDNLSYVNIYRFAYLETNAELEVHLMAKEPESYLEKRVPTISKFCLQFDARDYVDTFVKRGRELGYRIGLSIGPQTQIEEFEEYVPKIDYIQFMTTKPGKQGGNIIIPQTLEKLSRFKHRYPRTRIQTDGGADEQTFERILKSGADDVVIGSALFKFPFPGERLRWFTGIERELRHQILPMTQVKHDRDILTSLAPSSVADTPTQNQSNSFLAVAPKPNVVTPENAPPVNTTSAPAVTQNKIAITKIGFFGGAAWTEAEEPYKDAYSVAKILAENGYHIVNGGGPGVMKASTEGAHAGGGKALAITYHPNKVKRHYEGVDPANKFDEEIITLDYFDRTKVMLQNTDLHIVFKGSLGTLSELGMTWISSWIHEPNSKPIILYGEFWKEFLATFKKVMKCTDAEIDHLKVLSSPDGVLEYVKSLQPDNITV